MYMNTAYLKNTLIAPRTPADQEDLDTPLRVLCCGVYRIYTVPRLPTLRPEGRKDYQLLYFHSGQGHFYFENDEEETIVRAGQMVLFCPGERQVYHYCAGDKTEVYWVHFTGNKAAELLTYYGLPAKGTIIRSGVYTEYKDVFFNMITELQLAKPCYEDMTALLLRKIFILLERCRNEKKNTGTNIQREIDSAVRYFSENYNQAIVVQEYAREHFLSPCWFNRNFKQYTGLTPTQYITSIRISNAQSLLENPIYSINEIAHMVGYEDALYFSRAFKKHAGYSPKEYRLLLSQRP